MGEELFDFINASHPKVIFKTLSQFVSFLLKNKQTDFIVACYNFVVEPNFGRIMPIIIARLVVLKCF